MDNIIKLLIDAIRKSSKFLNRDFFELETLQSTSRSYGIDDFAKQSSKKLAMELKESIGKYFPVVVFSDQDIANIQFEKEAVLVEVLDGFSNFSRALPFFAVVLTFISKKDSEISTDKVIINFPALNESFYANKDKGAWQERLAINVSGESRLRVSKIADKNNLVIGTTVEYFQKANLITDNLRVMGSYSYLTALVACGKIDVAVFPKRDISASGIELLMKEAGGAYKSENGIVVISNSLHPEVVDQLLRL